MPNEKELREISKIVLTNQVLLNTSQSMRDIFNLSMDRNPGKPAMLYFDESGKKKIISYASFKNQVFTAASKLSAALSSTPSGTVIGLKLRNSPKWPIFFWAILMSGHCPLLINATLQKDNTQNLLNQAKAKAIITNEEEPYDIPTYRVGDILNLEANYQFVPDWANHVIFCSSGTTGNAKLAVYNGKNMCAQILSSTDMWKVTADIMYKADIRVFSMIPFHHIFGFVAVLLWYTFYGKTLVFPSSMSTKDLLYACQKSEITHVFSVPLFWDSIAQAVNRQAALQSKKKASILDKMIAYNNHKIDKAEAGLGASKSARKAVQKATLGTKVRFAISGGGYLSPKTLSLINGIGYQLHNGYGMTELGVTSVDLSPEVETRLKGSIGKPLHGVEYKIRPLDGSNEDSNIGELLVRSGITYEREYIGGTLNRVKLDDEGFYATGDIAFRDNDGCFYIKSRIKETIILSNGENVYPDEIEDYFKDVNHLNNCVVLGAKPKGEKEELIALVVEVDNQIQADEIVQLKADIKAINASLPSEKRVQKIYLDRRPLPMANNMKVKRMAVKQALEVGSDEFLDFEGKRRTANFDGYDPKLVSDLQRKVTKTFSSVLLLPEFKIDGDADWGVDLSGDSMSYVEMIQELETSLGVKIDDSRFGTLMTVNDFVKEIIDTDQAPTKKGKKGGKEEK